MIQSHISFHNTSPRPMEEVLLKEFVPIEDVTSGTGIDGNQESTRYYNWDDLMPN